MPHRLDSREIVKTAERLGVRVSERFPDSGLAALAGSVAQVAAEMERRVEWLQRRHRPLQALSVLLVLGIVGLAGLVVAEVKMPEQSLTLNEFVETLDAGIGSAVFLGAALLFIASTERRIKRSRALTLIHELRGLAHIVDMHQLTKDPESVYGQGPATAHSPKRTLTPFLLGRYLDYCSELLALLGKVAAIYGQVLDDGVSLAAVDQIEDLASGLSGKIWQKMTSLRGQVAGER